MNIQTIKSMPDLINYYGEKDTNGNGILETGEISNTKIKRFDKSGDNVLSSWEVMTAVNRIQRSSIFSKTKIKKVQRLNKQGITFPRAMILQKDTLIKGIMFKANKRIIFYRNGQIKEGTLARDISFQKQYSIRPFKFTLKAHTLIRFKSGKISHGVLAKDSLVQIGPQRVVFQAGSDIFFNKLGIRGVLAKNTLLRNGNHRLTFKRGTFISFYLQTVSRGIISTNTLIQTGKHIVSIKAGRVDFYPNGLGTFRSGILASTFSPSVAKYKLIFRANKKIEFHPNGQVLSGTLDSKTSFQLGGKHIILKADLIELYNNGNIEAGFLDQDTMIRVKGKDLLFKAGHIVFHKNGNISEGILAKKTNIQGKLYGAGMTINFDKNGSFQYASKP